MQYNPIKDTNRKHYIDKDVYTAAKERILDAVYQSDNQVVLCSGGKDSVATVHLLGEVYKEQGIDQKINIIFMDEELIGQQVVDYVKQLHDNPRYNLYWFDIPITCDKYNTGNTTQYIQNDPQRKKRVHHAPSYAITLEKLGLPSDTILDRYQLADIQANLFKGKVCLFKGIRCEESLFRLTQVLRRPDSPHIGGHTKKHFECIPIYDWTTRDVFLYFYKNKIPYNPMYNGQMYGGAPLRLSTPIHPYNQQTYNNLRSIDPELYQSIVDVFPDMAHADRYNTGSINTKHKDFQEYPHSIQGLMQYIDECYQDKKENHTVKKRILWAYKRRNQNKNKKGSDKFGGYPLYHLFRIVQRGATMRNITPCDKPSSECYKFEGYTIQDYIQDKNNRGRYTCNQ